MKQTLTFLTLLITCFAFGQSSRIELSNSKIYLKATYFNKVNKNIGLQTRTDLSDTLIDKIRFRKYQIEDFTDYSQKRERSIYYETFENGNYSLLDNKLNIIHKLNYKSNKEQTATLFGKQSTVDIEFLDTRNSFPKDSLTPTEKTPRKYFDKQNSEIYLILISDLKTLAVSSNGQFYTKQLFGDNYNNISNGLKNNYQASTKFEIEKGDEIQLFYRRKWYNDTTNIAEYEDKQFKNFKYVGDTITDKGKALIMEVEGYNYLSGSRDNPEQFLVNITESGYYSSSQFIPFKTYSTELKLTERDNEKQFSLQGVDKIEQTENSFYKIIQANSNDQYRYYILPFFPVPYIEFGNVQGIITYTKIKGIAKGKKRERTFITNKTNIRDIISKSKTEVEIQIYFTEVSEVEIEIQDLDTEKKVGTEKTKSKIGLNTFLVKCSKLDKAKEYGIQINYSSKESSGSFSNSVKNKY
jgi:hypothetical protein